MGDDTNIDNLNIGEDRPRKVLDDEEEDDGE